jgi:hypothetical protein
MSPDQHWSSWQAYLSAIPWAPGGLDAQECAAFSKARDHEIDIDLAIREVIARMEATGAKGLRKGKIRKSAEHIYGTPSTYRPPIAPKPEPYQADKLKAVAQELPEPIDDHYIYARSLLTPWNRTPAGFLHALYLPGESGWVTANSKSPNGVVWSNSGPQHNRARWAQVDPNDDFGDEVPTSEQLEGNFSCLDFFAKGHEGVWFLNNPIDGEAHHDSRFMAGKSWRCIEAVTSWRYLVLETDQAIAEDWLAFLVWLPWPVVAIYHSGGRGPHGLVRIEARDKAESDDIAELMRSKYVPLGADPGALTSMRLTRLPNCRRGQTGQQQKLLFLNPEARDGQRICDLPVLRTIERPPSK